MSTKKPTKGTRRVYPEELKTEAVQMLFDGHSAPSVAQNLGIPHTSLLYRWKAEDLGQEGKAASTLEARVRQLEERLRRTERERDILKKPWPFSARGANGGLPRGDAITPGRLPPGRRLPDPGHQPCRLLRSGPELSRRKSFNFRRPITIGKIPSKPR